MSATWPRILPAGDRGLLVEFAPELCDETNGIVRGSEPALATLPGVLETVPAFRSILLVYDPLAVSFGELADRAEEAARSASPAPPEGAALVEVPVLFGGEAGPDLAAVAAERGMSPQEVVRRLCSRPYTVFMLGFAPGFPYLGLVPPELRLPRRATPRPRVPPGSVAVADAFVGIYPHETAGGWHLLGRTRFCLFDQGRSPPCLMRPGDRVRFIPSSTGAAEPGPDATAASPRSDPGPLRPVLEVLEPGLLTTIQDLGRVGWRRFGVPASGALDRAALRAANRAVGNAPGAAALEFAFPGPTLRAVGQCEVVVAGADLGARHNGAEMEPGRPVRVRRGDLIEFSAPLSGQWAYLGLSGGLDAPMVMGSRSTNSRGGLSGLAGRGIKAGETLGAGEQFRERSEAEEADSGEAASGRVRVILGPQADAFTPASQAAFLSGPYRATVRRDRAGMRAHGPSIVHRESAEILSDGLLPGAVQIPADGQPLVILADGPTTGGYPKVAWVIDADLDRIAQMAPGVSMEFRAVSVEAAHAELRARNER